jgi:MFS family permease
MSSVLARLTASGWLVVVVSFLVLTVSFSARSILGLAMPYLESDLGWSRSLVSTGGAAALVVMAAVAPFAGNMLDRFGPRALLVAGLGAVGLGMIVSAAMDVPWHFFVGFSLFAGVGFGLAANHVVSTVVSYRFEENRGLAVGTATSGSTAGQLLLVPLLASVLTVADWRWSYLTLGLVSLALIPIVWVFIGPLTRMKAVHPGRAREALAPIGERLRLLGRSFTFHMLFWSFIICGFTTTGVIETHLLPYAAACGFPPLESATAYGVLSAFNLMGMIGAGYLADRVNRPLLLGAIYVLRGLSFVILLFVAGDLKLLFIFAVMFGLFDYATFTITAHIVASHLGLRIMGLSMGILSAGHSLGAAAGAFMGGVLFDLFARYQAVWVASIVLALAAGVMAFSIRENRARPVPVLAAA